ncbi:uncharacterized protein UTRI_10404 [Ustilago trichophora]|uniref:Uncharacterized protein n=1 Tax=Ustilago trichophora TaxID=86804 RepID=A0A5C3ECD0_9BASI|nr:uncharacterized protein UTRI_10404 [Ustilago trichophora]
MTATSRVTPFQPYRQYDGMWPWDLTQSPWVQNRDPRTRSQAWYRLNRFRLQDGREFGPFQIGSERFETKPYPHDLPFLTHSYLRVKMRPSNFELFGAPFNNIKTIFRPDPDILHRIQIQVTTPLHRRGWVAEAPGDTQIKQGEFLWPPLRAEQLPAKLYMAPHVRQALWGGVMAKFLHHSPGSPTVFHLTLPGRASGHAVKRHMLMTSVDTSLFTDMPSTSVNSDLWVFYEAMTHSEPPHQAKMALLGGMFLPKYALTHLVEDGVLRPAFVQRFVG